MFTKHQYRTLTSQSGLERYLVATRAIRSVDHRGSWGGPLRTNTCSEALRHCRIVAKYVEKYLTTVLSLTLAHVAILNAHGIDCFSNREGVLAKDCVTQRVAQQSQESRCHRKHPGDPQNSNCLYQTLSLHAGN